MLCQLDRVLAPSCLHRSVHDNTLELTHLALTHLALTQMEPTHQALTHQALTHHKDQHREAQHASQYRHPVILRIDAQQTSPFPHPVRLKHHLTFSLTDALTQYSCVRLSPTRIVCLLPATTLSKQGEPETAPNLRSHT